MYTSDRTLHSYKDSLAFPKYLSPISPSQFSKSPKKVFRAKDLMTQMKDLNFNNNYRDYFRIEERPKRVTKNFSPTVEELENYNTYKSKNEIPVEYTSFTKYMETRDIALNKENQGIQTKSRIKVNIDYLIERLHTNESEDKELLATKNYIFHTLSCQENNKLTKKYYTEVLNYLTKTMWGNYEKRSETEVKTDESESGKNKDKYSYNLKNKSKTFVRLPLIGNI